MNNFLTTIGLEIHTTIKTNTKMFSPALSSHNAEPNANVHPIDIGIPGTLPQPNAMAVEKAIFLAKALQMEVDSDLCFDRKNYFYPDLPRGFQITQQFRPIGSNGHVFLEKKTIEIERIHIEEDTAKQLTSAGQTLVDYNRCGMPLIEIVTKPSMNNADEVLEFLTALKRILIHLGVSDGKMEDGSLRIDLNISVSPVGSRALGTRAEIKNINSFSNVGRAISYEQDRQIKLALAGQKMNQETRRWDDIKNQTVFMREKINPSEYHYIVEPNVVKIALPVNYVAEISARSPKLPHDIQSYLMENEISKSIVDQLLDNIELYKIFEYVNSKIKNVELTITWVVIEMGALCKKEEIPFSDLKQDFIDRVIEMLYLLKDKKINGKQAKTLFEKIYFTGEKCSFLIEKLNISQIADADVIEKMLLTYIEQNPQMLSQYNERPERVEKFFVGLLMRDTKGQANPSITIECLRKLITQRSL